MSLTEFSGATGRQGALPRAAAVSEDGKNTRKTHVCDGWCAVLRVYASKRTPSPLRSQKSSDRAAKVHGLDSKPDGNEQEEDTQFYFLFIFYKLVKKGTL